MAALHARSGRRVAVVATAVAGTSRARSRRAGPSSSPTPSRSARISKRCSRQPRLVVNRKSYREIAHAAPPSYYSAGSSKIDDDGSPAAAGPFMSSAKASGSEGRWNIATPFRTSSRSARTRSVGRRRRTCTGRRNARSSRRHCCAVRSAEPRRLALQGSDQLADELQVADADDLLAQHPRVVLHQLWYWPSTIAAPVEKFSVIVAATVLALVELTAAGAYAAIRQDADARAVVALGAIALALGLVIALLKAFVHHRAPARRARRRPCG